jgi:hypothetical protein
MLKRKSCAGGDKNEVQMQIMIMDDESDCRYADSE